jgi:hypothetical protein
VLPGPGLGLWTGGTGSPALLLLGTEHVSLATVTAPPDQGDRLIFVVQRDGLVRSHVLGRARPLARPDAVRLLATTRAPVVLMLAMTEDTVTVVEAQ